jgi:DNA-binding NarL/FixJ family response regulator
VQGSILVVDDDAAVRGLVVRILLSWGHSVISEAGSVAEALACADAQLPDIVLVDIGLPDGDGFSLTRQLCARSRPMRVVIFSSDADRANVAAAHRAGAIGFLPKDELSSPALRHLISDDPDGDGGPAMTPPADVLDHS